MTLDQILAEAYQNGHQFHAIFGAIIGGIASVASAALGSRKRSESTTTDQTSTSTVDFKKMVADATAAGFNPLTAMRSGAIGGYVTTRTKGKNVTTGSGGGGIGAGIADAVAGIAPMFGSSAARTDPIKTKSKTSGAISSTVAGQVFAGSRATGRTGSVVVAPRQTTVRSPVTSRPPIPGLMSTSKAKAEMGPTPWVRVYDPALGRERWGVNPDGADLDQLVVPVVEGIADATWRAFVKSRDALRKSQRDGLVRSRPATPAEIRASKESWHGGWLPSIGFSWK